MSEKNYIVNACLFSIIYCNNGPPLLTSPFKSCSGYLILCIFRTNIKSYMILIINLKLMPPFTCKTTHLTNFSLKLRENTRPMFILKETRDLPWGNYEKYDSY